MSKNNNEIINDILNKLNEQEIKINHLKAQQKKSKRFIVFVVVICLILSGITGVASYTLGANQVGFTAKDTSWTVDNTEDAINELRDTVGAALVGSIYSYMGNNAPFGYLACDGTEYNIADYPRLAEHFTSEFGSANYFGGDGTTTFKVPDLRGEFLRGTGTNSHMNTNLGVAEGSGASVGVHQEATAQAYIGKEGDSSYGYFDFYGHNNNASDGSYSHFSQSTMDAKTISTNSRLYSSNYVWRPNGGSGVNNFTTRPTNTSVLYIIKY